MTNKYRTLEFESRLKEVCKSSQSMMQAASSMGMHFNTFKSHAVRLGVYNPNQAGKGMTKKANKVPIQDILSGLHPHYQTYKLKNRLLNEGFKPHKCENCTKETWLGQPIPLELHHIDGNRTNHAFSNLQFLCPNCHSLTPTFRGKNRN